MSPEMSRFDRVQILEESSPESASAPKPQLSQDAALAPDSAISMREYDARPSRRPRGFAAMDRALVKEIARLGGKAAHAAGTAHEFTRDEARVAGRKGGLAARARRPK
jgi:general stress protein YciG